MKEIEWINVKERLPDNKYLDCMVVVKVGDHYAIDRAAWTSITSFDYNSKKWIQYWDWTITVDWDEGQGCEVIYWMPYPRLPEEIEVNMLKIDEF